MIRPEDIRPSPLLPAPLEALDQDVLDVWCDELFDAAREAVDAEATPEQFRAEITPAPITSICPGALVRVRSWVTL